MVVGKKKKIKQQRLERRQKIRLNKLECIGLNAGSQNPDSFYRIPSAHGKRIKKLLTISHGFDFDFRSRT